ncbi:uncharacterized protein TNCV_500371 [Trichonephila clavipes]|nr:uncharacterized protein TNCV_500371 [Trichonephila clavipes]
MKEQHDWLYTVLWTDETHLTHSGAVNTHNYRWTTENPHAFVEVPLQQPNKVTQSALLQNNIIPELQARQAIQTVTFMQDGAPPHIALPMKRLLRSTSGEDCIISRYFNHLWTPTSPDLGGHKQLKVK